MKIAMIGQKGIPAIYGGIERHVEELSRELVANGNEILVYARKWYTPENITSYEGIEIIHTACINSKHLDAITHTFTSTINAIKQKPDIIHYHGVGPSLLAWIPRILAPSIKIVITPHSLDRYHQKWNWFARLMLKLGEKAAAVFADEVISISKSLRNYYINEYKRDTVYIPNGIRKVEKSVDSKLIQKKFNLKPKKYIVMVSRLVKHKGVHYLLEAWQFARAQYPKLFSDYKLVIVGGSSHTDDYVAQLKDIARGDDSIIFTGWQKEDTLDELYANALFLTHPSENEGLPLTVLQAMSFGTPVLVSDIPEHKEIVLNNKYWFGNACISDLADKLIKTLQNKSELKLEGLKNKKFVEKNYNWKDIVEKTEHVYKCNEECKLDCSCVTA